MTSSTPIELALRVADGRPSADDLAAMQRAFAAWISAAGAVPLERCFRLPVSQSALQRALRDLWLIELHRLVGVPGIWLGPVAVSQQLDRFVERGPWRHWRKRQDPPGDASPIDAAAFRVVKAAGGKALGARQIQRVVAQLVTDTKHAGNVSGPPA